MTKYWQSLSFCRGMNMVSENAKYLKNRKIGKWPGTESNCRHEDFQTVKSTTEGVLTLVEIG
jgi:hypothetical protein